MKIALAAVGFYERDIEYNRNKILKCLKENSGKAELILFGETFLQGFEVLDWKYETDQHMALSVSDSNIQMIRKAAEENALAVSFGFLEKAEDKIYSSQLTIGAPSAPRSPLSFRLQNPAAGKSQCSEICSNWAKTPPHCTKASAHIAPNAGLTRSSPQATLRQILLSVRKMQECETFSAFRRTLCQLLCCILQSPETRCL